ncbi:MAG: DMT family transporter [Betaproteobacteria bacterium]|nr:DMT family transporter [Betaproteobacteria bacterium]
MQTQHEHLPPRLLWILAGLTIAWGFNWTALKVALAEVSPWTFRSLCLGAGSGVLFAALCLGGQPLGVPRGQWGRLMLLALFNITSWNILIAYGVSMIPSGRAAILAYTMPVWSIPLSMMVLGERLTVRRATGLGLGMAGMALLLSEDLATLRAAPLGTLLALGAALSWGLGTVLQKRYPVAMPVGAYTAWIMLIGGVPIFIGTAVFDLGRPIPEISLLAALGVLYNVVIAFAWAHWAWLKLATALPVSVFSISMLVIPVVGVFSGMVFLGERPSWQEYAALLLVIASLWSVAAPRRA